MNVPPARPVWHWFMLISPAAGSLLVCLTLVPVFDSNLAPEVGILAAAYCCGLAVWWNGYRPAEPGLRATRIVVGTVLLMLLNGAIFFAGCTVAVLSQLK